MKKFRTPVTWSVSTYIEVEAEDIDEAIHAAHIKCFVHAAALDLIRRARYVDQSFEVDYDGVYEAPDGENEWNQATA